MKEAGNNDSDTQLDFAPLVMEADTDGIVIHDRDMRYVYLNPAAERLLGLSFTDLKDQVAWERLPEAADTPIAETYRQVLRDGEPVTLEMRSLLEKGQWFDIRIVPFTSACHRTGGGVVTYIRDITVRKNAEERQQLVARLFEKLRDPANPRAALADALRSLGEFLEAGATGYLRINEAEGTFTLNRDWARADMQIPEGTYPIEDFGTEVAATLRTGQPLAVADVQSEARIPVDRLPAYAMLGVRSFLLVPVLQEGHWVGTLAVGDNQVREWSHDEVGLVAVIAERFWLTIERARFAEERSRAEKALRESERQYRLLANAMPQLVWTANPDGTVDYYNERVTEFQGISRTPEGNWTWNPVLHKDDVERTMHTWTTAVRTGQLYECEHRVCMANGVFRWHLSRGVPMRDDAGNIVKWFGTATDINAQKLAEQSLAENEAMLQLAGEAGKIGAFDWDIVNDRILYSDQYLKIYGISHFEGGMKDWIRFVHPDDRERMETLIARKIAAREREVAGDFRIIRPDGQQCWIEVRANHLYDESGNPIRAFGVNVDITERKMAEEWLRKSEEQLRDSEARFRTLADNIAQFAWMADASGWLFWYNQRWFDYTGTTLEEMQGWGWRKVHHPDHVDRVVNRFAQKVKAGEVWEDTFPLRAADGTYRWFLSRAMPIRDNNGHVVRWFGTNTDITELRQTQEALQESEKRFRNMADSAPAILWVTDATTACVFLSRGWYEYTGQSEETALGYGWLDAVHPDDREFTKERFLRATARREPFALDYRVRGADGEYRWAIDTGQPRISESGDFMGFIGSVIDIHDRKQIEAERDTLLQQQTHIARTLQNSLLLASAQDAYAGLLVKPFYRSAKDEAQVGGDFFDVFAIRQGQVALVVGDAVGKGIEAATYTAEVKFALRAFLREYDSPGRALERLNEFVMQNGRLDAAHSERAFTALVVAVLDTEQGILRCAAAGAEPPFVVRAATGEAHVFTAGGPLLGTMPDSDFPEETLLLETGDLFAISTDGITEARRRDSEQGYAFFGYDGFVQTVQELGERSSLEEIGNTLIERTTAFADGKQQDDICLLLARRTA
ncbi:MAG: hypothetical protein OHK0029_39180 [Armatimonadaceae bacterium]